MSGSFWKFGQNYANESPLSKLLNRAFIKVDNNRKAKKEGADDTPQEKFDKILSSSSSHSSEDDEKKGSVGGRNRAGRTANDDSNLRSEELNNEDEEDEEEAKEGQEDEPEVKGADSESEDEDEDEDDKSDDHDRSIRESSGDQPDNESDFKDFEPNMDVLDELLDDEELYTELMCSNFKLLIYFKYPQVLARLVDYVTNEQVLNENLDGDHADTDKETSRDSHNSKDSQEGLHAQEADDGERQDQNRDLTDTSAEARSISQSDELSVSSAETSITLPADSEEQSESRRARMAAEILSADVWPISSAFMDHEELLSQLWSILDHPAPLSIVPSTYFMKINERLLDMDVAGILHFILTQPDLVNKFLTHIDNPPLMDFLLKVISTDKPDSSTGVIELLGIQDLIPKLLDCLESGQTPSTKSAAGDFLKALITISANSNNEIASAIGPNGLTRKLVSPPMVEKLMKIMLTGGTSLSNGVGIIIELIRKNNSDYDFVQVMYTTLETHPPNDRDPIYLGYLIQCSAKHLPEFNKMLMETELPPLETPFGFIEPLGFERFKICELVAELLHCSNMTLLNEPGGEQMVAERDALREKTLTLEKSEALYNKNEISGEGSDVMDKMADLRIATTDASNSSDDEERDLSSKEEAPHTAGDVQSDDSTDSELSEKALRENPVVGDQLKIALQDNCVITAILEMFFSFPWNNFLHNVVFDIVQQIFNGPLKTGFNRFLIADLFTGARLTHMIMEGDKKCEDYENETGLRLGYMGHLTLIAEEVAKFAAYVEEMKITFCTPTISESLNESEWKKYTDTVLADTRENYSSILGDFEEEEDDHEGEHEGGSSSGKYQDAAANDVVEYRNYGQEGDEDDDYAEYNSVDSPRYYQYDDGQGNKTNIHLNPSIDYHVGPGSFAEGKVHEYDDDRAEDDTDDRDEESEDKNIKNDSGKGRKSKFSSYMSHQLSKEFNTSFSSDDEEEDAWNGALEEHSELDPKQESGERSQRNPYHASQFGIEDDEDDYMDPNDDGLSYAKPNHPLYDSMLSQKNSGCHLYFNQDVSNLEENEEDSDDSDKEDVEEDDGQYSLCRTSSKDNMAWDSAEQNRIINTAQYRHKLQGPEK
ncbi:LAME_0A05622g1_1 [Lachancea meyersii CBS 8951]|uniref:LAME_0A05622g1_1 n=1 Tax=Lachancea meyersii CBS 8951 TaxID=1266667 RepID=A0A1G4IPW7_9SACH|nr:LAME_0A05622g1_1 [Lachancea meyersii CBS 8951]